MQTSTIARGASALLLLILAATSAVATEQPWRPGPETTPGLRWLNDSTANSDIVELAAYGLVVGDGSTEATRVLDPETGSTLMDDLGACLGTGPVGADLEIRYIRDSNDLLVGATVHAVDEHTGTVEASALLTLDTGPEPVQTRGCRIIGGYGDLTLLSITAQRLGSFLPFSQLYGVRASATAAELLWEGSVGNCPSTLAGFSERPPRVIGGVVVRTTSDCTAFTLTAVDLRTGEVLAQMGTGDDPSVGIAPAPGAFAGALILGDPLTAVDLMPTAEGLQWVERWTAEIAASEYVGEGGDWVLVRRGEDYTTVGAADGSLVGTIDVDRPPHIDSAGMVFGGRAPALIGFGPSGEERWSIDTKDVIHGGAATVVGTDVVTIGPDRALYVESVRDTGARDVVRLDLDGAVEPREALRIDAGDDPIDMAIQTCRRIEPSYQQAGRVLIARNDVFADALAGAALAGPDGCILYVAGGPDAPLDRRTLYEAARVLPAGGRVYILGGTQAVSTQVENDLVATGYDVVRLAGAGRIDTAALIAREVAATGFAGGRGVAYVATAGDYPDAVTAGAHAALAGIPVLLSNRDQLPPATAQALEDLGITRTVLLGGTAAVSDAVLEAVPGGERVAGSTRFGTAAQVATTLWDTTGIQGVLPVAIDTDTSWQTALASAPLSAALHAPQIGVAATVAPSESIDAVATIRAAVGPVEVTAVGSPTVLPSAVLVDLLSGGP